MSEAQKQLEYWLNDSYFDDATKEELLAIRNNEDEVEDRFYKELEFGTGGLRGVIGAGTNRMNKYTVRKATQGLANYIKKHGGPDACKKGVAISCNSFYSSSFSLLLCCLLSQLLFTLTFFLSFFYSLIVLTVIYPFDNINYKNY